MIKTAIIKQQGILLLGMEIGYMRKAFLLIIILLSGVLFMLNACNSTKQANKTQPVQYNKTVKTKKIPTDEQFKAVKLVDARTNYNKTIKAMGDTSHYYDSEEFEVDSKTHVYKRKEVIRPTAKRKRFCHNLFSDFVSNKNIEIIKPIVHTNDFNDKKLQPYWKKCPFFKQRLNIVSTRSLRIPNGIYDSCISSSKDWVVCTEGSYPPESYAQGHFNYQLYDIDFDNNIKNGKQSLFYTGGVYHPQMGNSPFDIYSFIDFKECKIIKKYNEEPIIDIFTLKKKGNYNGLFKYKINGKYYTYELYHWTEDNTNTLYFNYLNYFNDGIHINTYNLNTECGYGNIKE